jgi:hypothetical protein
MDVRMRRAILTAVLVDREHTLDSACRAAEGLVYGVAQDALGQAPVKAGEALGRAVVYREDEPEVDWVPKASGVLDKRLSDGPLVAAEGAVSRADSVQLAPLSVAESLLPMRDVADLVRGSLRVVVVPRLDEEHLGPLFLRHCV